jgi:hypothetical protein
MSTVQQKDAFTPIFGHLFQRLNDSLKINNEIKPNVLNFNDTKEKIFNIIKEYIPSKCDNHNIPQYKFITNHKVEIIENIYILKTESFTNGMHNLGYVILITRLT